MLDRYHPDSEQVAFADSVGKSLQSMLPLSRLHDSSEESSEVWTELKNLGVFGISAPEDRGGSGLGAAEEALIVMELGRRVVTPSVLATVGAAHLLAAANRVPAPAECHVAAGYRRGDRVVFIEDSAADLLLVRTESGAVLFDHPQSSSSRVVDTQLWSSRLREAVGLGEPWATATPAQSMRLRLIEAAALAGLAQAALEMAVGYAGMREQFGRPIGSFQAVKHHCANLALAARCARDQVSFAAVALDDGRDDAALQVESAFYVAGSAALESCGKNIQIHGGIGFSDEADPHRLLKRARTILEIAGGLEAAVTRIGDHPPSAEFVAPESTRDRAH
jgi:alkylation response protein AidB-like acyl-CoA dehydrogenase